jgi:hypothetical protein
MALFTNNGPQLTGHDSFPVPTGVESSPEFVFVDVHDPRCRDAHLAC